MSDQANDAKAPPVFEEIAVIGGERDITRGYVRDDLVYPQDRLLQAKGGDIAVYEDVLSDDQVKACFEQRRLAVVSREWVVEPGGPSRLDRKAADFMREQLNNIRWDAVTNKALYGVYYGFAVAECMYARDGATIALEGVRVRRQKRFRFDAQGRPRLRTLSSDDGIFLPPRKFWTFSTGADSDDEPYGLGLAHWLYWPTFFKRNSLRIWLTMLDKFAVPTAVGKYPAGADEATKRKLLAACMAVRNATGIAIPEGMLLELLEAKRSGALDGAPLYDRMNSAISKVTVGQTMTTDDGSSQSQAVVHMQVRDDLVKADADLVCESWIMGPGRWLTEWNFPGAAVPRVWRRVDTPDLASLASIDKSLFDIGFKPTLNRIQTTYGEDYEEKAPPAPPPGPLPPVDPTAGPTPTPADPAFTDQQDAADDLAGQLRTLAAPLIGKWVAQISTAIDEVIAAGGGMPELVERMIALYPSLSDAELGQLIAQAMTAADLTGRVELLDGV